jgi:mannose-6-phosphate isomerase-like protein (cupin superfamily)
VDRHQTPTVDLLFIVSGQLELIMDTGTKVVAGGDLVVQRATAHAFRVVGNTPCIFYGVAFEAATA